jgi:hypothetical protein
VDPAEPDSAEGFTVDAAEWLEPGETLANDRRTVGVFLVGGVPVILAPDGESLYLAVFGERLLVPEAVLVADLGGRVLSRVDVAGDDDRRTWLLAGQLGGDVIVASSRAMPDVVAFSWTLYAVSGTSLNAG